MSIKAEINRIKTEVSTQSEIIQNIKEVLKNNYHLSVGVFYECGEVYGGTIECGEEKQILGTPIEKNAVELKLILDAVRLL